MKWHLAYLAVIGMLTLYAKPGYADPSTERTALANQFLLRLSRGEYAQSTQHFDAQMKEVFPPESIQKVWTSIVEQCGEFISTGAVTSSKDQGYDTKVVVCRFKNAVIDARVVFNDQQQITGLWFRPHTDPLAPKYTAPPYVKPTRFTELSAVVGSGKWKLPATISIPKGKGLFPAVVLVHGSGAHDRDETIGPNKPFNDLAQGLASMGIAVLRYEKRTKAYGVQMAREGVKITVKEEVLDDALLAVQLLRRTKQINPNRIYVLGHSLGGLLVPRIGFADPKIKGLISMAGPSRPVEELIMEQVTYLAALEGKPSPEAQKTLDGIKADVAKIKLLSPKTPLPEGLLVNAPATYWLDLNQYKPREVVKRLKMPLLFIQGGRDYQVTRVDLDGWMASLKGRKTATFKFYPQLNHLMQEGVGKSKPSEYDQRKPVNHQVVEEIANWIKQH